jgi:hypothetical protein
MPGGTRLAALAGGTDLAVFAAAQWFGRDPGAPDDVESQRSRASESDEAPKLS